MTTYAEIRPEIKTGDLFLCSGDGLVSDAIKAAQWMNGEHDDGHGWEFSHVGMFYRVEDFPPDMLPPEARERLAGDRVLIVESTTLSDIADIVSGRFIKGVQAVPASERLAAYDGQVAWRRIIGPRTPEMMRLGAEFLREFHGTPYEQDELELALAAIDGFTSLTENQPDTHSLFCSETNALFARRAGFFLPLQEDDPDLGGEPANEFTPADFAGNWLPFTPGYSAGEIVMLESA